MGPRILVYQPHWVAPRTRYHPSSSEVDRQPWLDMFGRLAMSACAGQRMSGEASGWVWWSSSRTDWNYGHGCSHGDGASQPKQQGSTVQLLNIISSPVRLSACAARTKAPLARKVLVRVEPAIEI